MLTKRYHYWRNSTKYVTNITHNDLVKIGCKFAKTHGFPLALGERLGYGENPDVLAYNYSSKTLLIECKVSHEDFERDFKKKSRTGEIVPMGSYRIYLAPIGLLKQEEMPEGWLLFETDGRRVYPNVGNAFFAMNDSVHEFTDKNYAREMSILYSETIRRRLPPKKETKRLATSAKLYAKKSDDNI